MSYHANEQQLVERCDSFMESGRAKVFEGDPAGALEEFQNAVLTLGDCVPALRCCAILKFVRDDRPGARYSLYQAQRLGERPHSDISAAVYQDVWAELMYAIIGIQPLKGSEFQVKHEKLLPTLPPYFKSTSTPDSQQFNTDSVFTPEILRVAETVQVTLKLKKAEFGVPNFFRTKEFQGYFVFEFEIDVSPSAAWKSCCELTSVGGGRNTQPVQEQRSAGFSAQFGMSGSTPGGNLTYTMSETIALSKLPQQMIAYKTGDDKVWRSAWKVNHYANGEPFVFGPSVSKILELPFNPQTHVCSESDEFQGTWKVTANDAKKLHFHFDWDITVRAKLALLQKRRKRDILTPGLLRAALGMGSPHASATNEPVIERHSKNEMGDFSRTILDRIVNMQ